MILVINKRVGDKWFITGYEQKIIELPQKQYKDKLFNGDFFPEYQKPKATGFGSAFAGSLLHSVLNAGGIISKKS